MKSNLRILIYTNLIFLIGGCSSTPTLHNSETNEDKVISRIDDMSSRPNWLKESENFKISDGDVVSLGTTTIPGDHRVEAAMRVAQNNAKAGICSNIEQRLSFVFQQATEGTTAETTQAKYIGAEACELTTSSIRPGKSYWEKVATTRDSGERVTQYRVFASVTMTEQDLKTAILSAAKKREGKGGISEDFAKKVDAHWDQFVKGEQKGEAEHK